MPLKEKLRKLIPRHLVSRARAVAASASMAVAKVLSRSYFGASVYYLLFSSDFRREHRAVLLGKVAYWQRLGASLDSYVLLRRNTHRLEKGLIMRPRRDVFAQDYIEETVDCFAIAAQSPVVCPEELAWARDVLTKYFATVVHTQRIASSHSKFLDALGSYEAIQPSRIPYKHHRLPEPSVSFDALESLFTRRRSVRWFRDGKVPVEDIENAIRIASLAPSACNRQPFQFHIAMGQDAAKVAELPGGAAGFLHNIPCVIAVVGNLAAYPFEKDRHLIYIDGALASMQLMLALETLGLSTCAINWPDLLSRERKVQELLRISPSHHTVMLIAVGYADPEGEVPYSQKKTPATLMKLR